MPFQGFKAKSEEEQINIMEQMRMMLENTNDDENFDMVENTLLLEKTDYEKVKKHGLRIRKSKEWYPEDNYRSGLRKKVED